MGLGAELRGDSLAAGGGFLMFLVFGGAAAFFGDGWRPDHPVVQPIAFNHLLHVEEEGLECLTCHRGYEKDLSSGLPGSRACALCHLEPQGEGAEERRLAELLQRGGSLQWKPLFMQPPHVFFSHRRHVVVAEIECATCHGNIGESEAPPDRRDPLTMKECVACHEQREASTDCSACHR